MFMQDRESNVVMRNIADDMVNAKGLQGVHLRRALEKAIFVSMIRRVFRSHPLLWASLYPRLSDKLGRSTLLARFDVEDIASIVVEIGDHYGCEISELYGAGRH